MMPRDNATCRNEPNKHGQQEGCRSMLRLKAAGPAVNSSAARHLTVSYLLRTTEREEVKSFTMASSNCCLLFVCYDSTAKDLALPASFQIFLSWKSKDVPGRRRFAPTAAKTQRWPHTAECTPPLPRPQWLRQTQTTKTKEKRIAQVRVQGVSYTTVISTVKRSHPFYR